MNEEREALSVSFAKMETELAHVNKHLEKIDISIEIMRDAIARQNELQKDFAVFLRKHDEIKQDINGLGRRVSENAKAIEAVSVRVDDLPKTVKVNVFDYVWKYILAAAGTWVSLKVAGVLP